MTKQFAIAARDHGAGIPDQCFHRMTDGRRLPFVTAYRTDAEYDLCDLLTGGACAIAVEGLQHPAQPRPLLAGHARVRRDGTAVQGGEQPMDCFEAVQSVDAERHERGCGRNAIVDELKILAVAEVDPDIGGTIRAQRNRRANFRQGGGWQQRGRNGSEHDDAGVVLR